MEMVQSVIFTIINKNKKKNKKNIKKKKYQPKNIELQDRLTPKRLFLC